MKDYTKEFIIDLFDRIEDEITAIERVVIKNAFDLKTNPNLLDSFSADNLSFPGLSVKYNGLIQTDYDVWVRVELNNNIVIGYYSPRKKKMLDDEIEMFDFTESDLNERNWLDYDILEYEDYQLSLKNINQLALIGVEDEFKDNLVHYIIDKFKELLK